MLSTQYKKSQKTRDSKQESQWKSLKNYKAYYTKILTNNKPEESWKESSKAANDWQPLALQQPKPKNEKLF
ncbi:hypothetical protein G6F32_013148 [Rhizopus arrhizus]|nr:hypothetical protein G6F32_013148 [Rhizopus arrhizus]